jgi:RNA 2',3'-cyclic 3'-phosphodiesterase
MTMEKRLFIAIPLSEKILEALEEHKKRIQVQNIRWISKNNLHITLYFLGDTKEEIIPNLVEKLKSTYESVNPFDLIFEKITFAPPNRDARMIWAQFQKNSHYENLVKLTDQTVKAVTQNITTYTAKDLIPHATLVRFKFPLDPNKIILKQPEIQNLHVCSCQLFESELNSGGSIYKLISEFNFNKNSRSHPSTSSGRTAVRGEPVEPNEQ